MTTEVTDDEAADAAFEILRRRRARETFVEYCRYLYPDEPPAEHHVLLCNALDDVIEGKIRNLMVFMPPGSAKSSYSSKRFPGYYLGRFPKKNIISASYGEGLSSNFGRIVRNTLDLREYKNLFQTKLSEDSRAKGEWETQAGGTYFATGVGGAITGRRADCLLGSTLVQTSKGEFPISEIDISSKSCYILSYEAKPVYRRILATLSRKTEEYFRIHTDSGRVVEVTGNHQIYTKSGYVKAADLTQGDVLMSLVQKRICFNGVRVQKETKEKYQRVLQYIMRWLPLEQFKRKPAKRMQGVRRTASSKVFFSFLRRSLQDNFFKEGRKEKGDPKKNHLRILWGNIRSAFSQNEILFDRLQESPSFAFNDGREQSRLAGRNEPFTGTAAFRQSIQIDAAKNNTKRSLLCSVLKQEKAKCPSYKHESIRQSLEKLGNALQQLPHKITRSRPFKTEKDTVALVERVRKPALVYDLQVEGTECFFANGVLVHNCGILDDPVKGRENADSETEREKIWQWYLSDYFTRLKPNSSQIIIQTRWHESDLAGKLLPEGWNGESGEFVGYGGQKWTVLCLPAQARKNDILGRKEGDWLWPEWFTPEFWENTKSVQTSQDARNWTSLYQQTPRPEEGIFFKRDWFKRYKLGEEPDLSLYGASDYGVTKDGGDPTEHGIGGFDSSNNLYFTDWWSGQTSLDESIKSQLFLAKTHNISTWFAEVGVIRRAIEPFLLQEKLNQNIYFHNEWLPHIGDKGANAASFKGLASMGKVYIPYTEWGDELINQLIRFIPNTNFRDDKVDVCGYFGRALNKVFGPQLTVVEPEKKKDGYGLDDDDENGWKTA